MTETDTALAAWNAWTTESETPNERHAFIAGYRAAPTAREDALREGDQCSPIAHAAGWETWQRLDAIEQRGGEKFPPAYRCMAVVQDAISAALKGD